jgi:chromosome segregation protein
LSGSLFLRSLQLLGFKTFARQTEILFEGGVTAIVGPNGSGKTNIVDSIKWVLGSGQARDLRGKKMEEVIYAGGERRNRASFAEVTMVFDNSAGRLPVDYREVAIKRRIERDGESDYYLNGTRIRRRDLIHMLASTGLTLDSYAIIDQHDIEHIVVCSAAERRQLLEEAAQVRGVKARRQEAMQRLQELANNLLRLEDLKQELTPRLEALKVQAEAAKEAAEAQARLELLRGSIVWEEWREARDAHRKASSQAQSLERRMIEAKEQAKIAEEEFQAWRTAVQQAQDRRLGRQRTLGLLRLDLAESQHALQLAEERAESHSTVAESAKRSEAEGKQLMQAAEALRGQLAAELDQAGQSETAVGETSTVPDAPDANVAQEARRAAEHARRASSASSSTLAGLRTRREFLEEQVSHIKEMEVAAAELPDAEASVAKAAERARQAEEAAVTVARMRSELQGLDALRPTGLGTRLGEVLIAKSGYEAALSAALGPLVDAVVASDETSALTTASGADSQVTALYPNEAPPAEAGSLLEHVTFDQQHEPIARRLLGHVVVGRDVTTEGVYRAQGFVRAGKDPRAAIERRRAELRQRTAELKDDAEAVTDASRALKDATAKLSDLRARSAGITRAQETQNLLAKAQEAEQAEAARLAQLEKDATDAEARASAASKQLEAMLHEVAERRAEAHQKLLEHARWRERKDDLARQLAAVDEDLARLRKAAEEHRNQLSRAEAHATQAAESIPKLTQALATAKDALAAAEQESPEDEAEMAENARKLVALEEARIDARLRVGTLDGNLELINREAELLQARMEEIRSRMPDGVAPEEVPGGKSREKEMRALERRLEEIGPTNALAESETRELEERYQTLVDQLQDIAAARADLEQLIAKLRDEEESRYEAVFGAVAANFNEYFSQLNPGGRATLKHAEGDEGPRTGVEILVQPPRKRQQNVTLLSSGERSLAALALVLALDEVNPSPFTILDEVDAALDDANVDRFGQMLARLGRERQFLVITHNHVTMSYASTLYGIHLDESGSSHLVSVRLDDIRKPAARAASHAQAG